MQGEWGVCVNPKNLFLEISSSHFSLYSLSSKLLLPQPLIHSDFRVSGKVFEMPVPHLFSLRFCFSPFSDWGSDREAGGAKYRSDELL